MDYWYHRIKHCNEVAAPLRDMGYLTAGLSDIAIQYPKIVTETFDKNEIRNMIEYSYKKRHNKKILENHRGKLKEVIIPASWAFFSFICEFKVGDKVIVINYPNKEYFVIFEVLEKADIISNLPINQFADLNGNDIKMEDGLLRRDYKTFIDIGFFIKVKKLTTPIEGTFNGLKAVSGSLNKIGDQIEEFIKRNLI